MTSANYRVLVQMGDIPALSQAVLGSRRGGNNIVLWRCAASVKKEDRMPRILILNDAIASVLGKILEQAG